MEEGNATLVRIKHAVPNSRCTETVGNEVCCEKFAMK
jgi:hypothetical protein